MHTRRNNFGSDVTSAASPLAKCQCQNLPWFDALLNTLQVHSEINRYINASTLVLPLSWLQGCRLTSLAFTCHEPLIDTRDRWR